MTRKVRTATPAVPDPHAWRRAPLTPAQLRWLGVFLLAALLPQAPYVPIWVAGFGTMLIGLRLFLMHRDRVRADVAPARIPSWTLALFAVAAAFAIRQSFGYFLGRDPCVAFLFVLAGIKYLEGRTYRDGTLIVCLGTFEIVTPFFYNQTLLAALAAVPSLLALGAVLQVLAQPTLFALPLSAWRGPVGRTVKLFAQGIPLAAVLFLLFPRLAGPLWGLPSDAGARSGLSDRMEPGSIAELSLSDAVAFRVDFDGPMPPPAQRYWRGPVLTRFDGREWTPGDRPTRRAVPPGGRTVSYWVTLEPHWRPWLFALDVPAGAPTAEAATGPGEAPAPVGAITGDQRVVAPAPVAQPLRYRQASVLADAYPAAASDSADAERAESLALPARALDANPRTVALARSLREQHPDDAGYVAAALRWFGSEPFYYTLAPPLLRGPDAVDAFLFETRRGFCEHYAAALVVLLRAAGIPARVVTGYQGGERNPAGDYLIVRQSDAHAWAEALVGGAWRRVDPTAAIAPSRIERGLGGALPSSEFVPLLARLDSGWLKEAQLAWDALNHDWRRRVVGFNFEAQRSLWRELRLDALAPPWIVALVAAFATVWGAAILGLVTWRRRRESDRALLAWAAFGRRLARAGLPREPHEGPLDYGARASSRWPEFAVAFTVIADTYASLRYGPAPESAPARRARVAALARLNRAIDVLPAPAALRKAAATP